MEILTNSTFDLPPEEMFVEVEELATTSLEVISLLSFDIIKLVVVSNEVNNYFESSVDNFEADLVVLEEKFSSLFERFQSLDENVTQDALNEIVSNFTDMKESANATLFPNISAEYHRIKGIFQNITFD